MKALPRVDLEGAYQGLLNRSRFPSLGIELSDGSMQTVQPSKSERLGLTTSWGRVFCA